MNKYMRTFTLLVVGFIGGVMVANSDAIAALVSFFPASQRKLLVIPPIDRPTASAAGVVWLGAVDSDGPLKLPGHGVAYVRAATDPGSFADISAKFFGFRPRDEMTPEQIKRRSSVPGFLCDDEIKRFPFFDQKTGKSVITNQTFRHEIHIWIDEKQLEKVASVVRRWRDNENRYHPTSNDCVTFIAEVAQAAGLETPNRSSSLLTPRAYMAALYRANISSPNARIY